MRDGSHLATLNRYPIRQIATLTSIDGDQDLFFELHRRFVLASFDPNGRIVTILHFRTFEEGEQAFNDLCNRMAEEVGYADPIWVRFLEDFREMGLEELMAILVDPDVPPPTSVDYRWQEEGF